MTRFVDTANQTAAAQTAVRMFVAVSLDFSSGFVRAHDGMGTITFGGYDYLGIGRFGGIEPVTEEVNLIARPLRLTLSGIDTTLLNSALTEVYQNRACVVYVGFVTEDNALVGTPETVWEGKMDQMTVSFGEGSGAIDLNCEHRLRRAPRIARYTDADQNLAYAGDRFFDLIGKIPGFRGTWGAEGVANDLGNRSGFTDNVPTEYYWS